MADRPFSRNVRQLRAERGFSKSSFAKAVGVSTTCVWNWEEGNTEPRPETLVKVARLLETSPDTLLGRAAAPRHAAHPPRAADGESPRCASLPEAIERARREIAALAGLDVDRVKVTLEYA